MNKLIRFFPLLLLVSVICVFPVMSVFADGENDSDKKEIDINLSPKDTLFSINNMKPGDWAPRTIIVRNSGSKDFSYNMELLNNGERKLFDELLLEVKAGEKELFNGKLAEFKTLSSRGLASDSEENLDMTIRFPKHLGNDFQGLEVAFSLNFTAEGANTPAVPDQAQDRAQAAINGQIDSGEPNSSGQSLPATSTNIFNLILFGSLLIAGGIALMVVRHYRRINPAE